MINHARTVLLNRADDYFSSVSDAIYIPGEFHPIQLDNILTSFKNIVIPSGITVDSEYSIANVLTTIISCPELLPYALLFDPRITYPLSSDISGFSDGKVVVTTKQSVTTDVVLHYSIDLTKRPISIGTAGNHAWTLTPISPSVLQVYYSRGKTTRFQVLNPASPGTSKKINLLGDYLTCYLEMPSHELTGSFTTTIQTNLSVLYNIVDIISNLQLGLAGGIELNRIFKSEGPYASTIQDLYSNWNESDEIVIRFGSIVLSYIFQCDMLR